MRFFTVLLVLAPTLLAHAESGEHLVGVEGSLVLPDFQAPSATAFALSAWRLGGGFEYGIAHDLFVGARFSYSQFVGDSPGFVDERSGKTGTLTFSGAFYQPEVSARYKVFGGYNLAPYVEVAGGYTWATYKSNKLLNDNQRLEATLPGFAEGSPTLQVGFHVDYRILNAVTIGAGVRATKAWASLYRAAISVPVRITYYWF